MHILATIERTGLRRTFSTGPSHGKVYFFPKYLSSTYYIYLDPLWKDFVPQTLWYSKGSGTNTAGTL